MIKPSHLIWTLLRVAVGALFVASGFTKLLEPAGSFLQVVLSYRVVTGFAAQATAFILPWTELVFGLFLILGLWTQRSLLVLWFLNTIFVAAIGWALMRKIPIQDCGCFGDTGFSLPLHQIFFVDLALWMLFSVLSKRMECLTIFALDPLFKKRFSKK